MIRPTGTVMSPARMSAGSQGNAVVGDQVAVRRRAHGRKPELAQRHLSRSAHEQPERQEEHDVHHAECPGRELEADEVGNEREEHDDQHRAGDADARRRGVRDARWGRGRGAAKRELGARGHEQRDEQHDERKTRRKAAEPRHVADVLRAERGADTEQQAADVGEGQVGEVPDRGGAVGLHDEQDEQQRVQPEDRPEEHARHRGEDGADHPRPPAHAGGVRARDVHELRVVDHAAHRDAEP